MDSAKMDCLSHSAIIMTAIVFVGCATGNRRYEATPQGSQVRVVFVQERSPEFDGRACYLIETRQGKQVSGRIPSNIKVDEGGVDGRSMIVGRDFKPVAAVSPSGRTILITEDCWQAVPGNAYLLVRLDPGQPPVALYIHLPEHFPPTGVNTAYPLQAKVVRISDDAVSFRFAGVTKEFQLRLPPFDRSGKSKPDDARPPLLGVPAKPTTHRPVY